MMMGRNLWRWGWAIVMLIGLWGGMASPATAAMFSFAGDRPANLGVHSGQLAVCATTPNCVSSYASDEQHQIAPLDDRGDRATTFAALKQVVAGLPDAKVIEQTDDYLYAEFTSQLMGFVDDVEFYRDDANSVIQVRSASRLGESDLGVNRQRIEMIRELL
jgi:uncharacterized protein (DUF1499 family)